MRQLPCQSAAAMHRGRTVAIQRGTALFCKGAKEGSNTNFERLHRRTNLEHNCRNWCFKLPLQTAFDEPAGPGFKHQYRTPCVSFRGVTLCSMGAFAARFQ